MTKHHQSATRGSAIVVGASLAGLMTALTLSRTGLRVTMLERSSRKVRTGAALPVSGGLVERLTGRRSPDGKDALPPGGQAWADVHAGLSSAAQADPGISLRSPVRVTEVGQDERSAWVVTDDGEFVRADLVVGADGHASVVRRHVVPEAPDATFSGYVIWLGLVDEREIRSRPWLSDLAILYERDYCLNAYYLPGADGSVARGERRIGWGWYDSSRNDLLRARGAVVDDVVQRTLRAADVPDATFDELAGEAREIWPSPWRDAIVDCIRRRAVIGTPIGEYLPHRLVSGRVCLVGDAAHLPSPMTGSGFDASAQDALALADALGGNRASVSDALRRYEAARLDAARQLVRSGQSFSNSFAPRGAAQ
ncbi:FAD-dependent monooxygenase [Amycolatopsis sp. ATCC 39116]|uniref:FAD-dependent monooxygenase n=1 Tax=Amycolatopsis sp. (strain ATCC 39116 / 75iv2) TaxID=385957 RepID=UPI0002626132|nr:FAD-dependent monooxygenase [Amycolatopsis sp. ATCC 39116]